MYSENIYNPIRLIREKILANTGDNYVFWPMGSNREKLAFFAFLPAFSKLTSEKLTICTLQGEPVPILKFFPKLQETAIAVEVPGSRLITAFSKDVLHLSCYLINSDRPKRGNVFFTNVGAYHDGRQADSWRKSGNRDFSHINLVRHILGLPSTVEPERIDLGTVPTVPDLVFFAPAANSFSIDPHVFLPMAEKCRATGLRVVWNFNAEEYASLGTDFKQQIQKDVLFKGSLFEALRFAKMAKLVVSARSAFCELLALSECRYGVVYGPDHTDAEKAYWNLDTFCTKPLFEITSDKTPEIFQIIP
jgi:hypothetical protein